MAGGISGIDAALRKEPSPGDDLGLYEQMVPGFWVEKRREECQASYYADLNRRILLIFLYLLYALCMQKRIRGLGSEKKLNAGALKRSPLV